MASDTRASGPPVPRPHEPHPLLIETRIGRYLYPLRAMALAGLVGAAAAVLGVAGATARLVR